MINAIKTIGMRVDEGKDERKKVPNIETMEKAVLTGRVQEMLPEMVQSCTSADMLKAGRRVYAQEVEKRRKNSGAIYKNDEQAGTCT